MRERERERERYERHGEKERQRKRQRDRERDERERESVCVMREREIAYLGGRSDASLATLELSGIQRLDRRRAIQLTSRRLLLHHTSGCQAGGVRG